MDLANIGISENNIIIPIRTPRDSLWSPVDSLWIPHSYPLMGAYGIYIYISFCSGGQMGEVTEVSGEEASKMGKV